MRDWECLQIVDRNWSLWCDKTKQLNQCVMQCDFSCSTISGRCGPHQPMSHEPIQAREAFIKHARNCMMVMMHRTHQCLYNRHNVLWCWIWWNNWRNVLWYWIPITETNQGTECQVISYMLNINSSQCLWCTISKLLHPISSRIDLDEFYEIHGCYCLPNLYWYITVYVSECHKIGHFSKWQRYKTTHNIVPHSPPDKMAAISQTTFLSAFSWMKFSAFWLKFQWSLFLRVQLTITRYWFR